MGNESPLWMASLHEADRADAPIITPQKDSIPKHTNQGLREGMWQGHAAGWGRGGPCTWLCWTLGWLNYGVAGSQSERAAGREEWRLLCFSGGHDEVCEDSSPPPTLSPTSTPLTSVLKFFTGKKREILDFLLLPSPRNHF